MVVILLLVFEEEDALLTVSPYVSLTHSDDSSNTERSPILHFSTAMLFHKHFIRMRAELVTDR